MTERPVRIRLPDFAGRPVSLPDGPESWQKLKEGSGGILLLGMGPGDPGKLPFVDPKRETAWIEAPQILQAGISAIPASWCRLDYDQAIAAIPDSEVWFYRPGLRIAPDFFGPLLAKAAVADKKSARSGKFAWLPGNDSLLLHRDLRETLQAMNFTCLETDFASPDDLINAWRDEKPAFALSVNFRGLDSEGRIFNILRELAIPLAIWLVDNPWNLLSGVHLPWWREAQLFVTDASFLDGLAPAGAKNTSLLPLAASPVMFKAESGPQTGPVFVGSSAFNAQKKFFAGVRLPDQLEREAEDLLANWGSPDFHWWQKHLDCRRWPFQDFRKASFGADAFSARRRAKWLAASGNLQIYGDQGWRDLIPGAEILAPVDYYADLPAIYRNAAWTLNVTSLLLPASLNQRHFDVWAAGGFLFTDKTAGLDIFPTDLVRQIALENPADLPARLDHFASSPSLKSDLAAEWRDCIACRHTYKQRLEAILERIR